jgi:hypothetical protein
LKLQQTSAAALQAESGEAETIRFGLIPTALHARFVNQGSCNPAAVGADSRLDTISMPKSERYSCGPRRRILTVQLAGYRSQQAFVSTSDGKPMPVEPEHAPTMGKLMTHSAFGLRHL